MNAPNAGNEDKRQQTEFLRKLTLITHYIG